jgi:small subunit ribosomal protein S8
MFVNDVLSDMMARINNAQQARLTQSKVIKSKISLAVLSILKEEGFIDSFEENKNDNNFLIIDLKYDMGKPIINVLKRVSKPGRRVYSSIADLPKFYNGLGVTILSTPQGVLADYKARDLNVGGEVLCVVF